MKPTDSAADSGFTLIEVLIAVFIMATLSTIGVSLVTNTLSAKRQVESRLEKVQQLVLARSVMKSDFGQMSDRRVRDLYGERELQAFRVGEFVERGVLVAFVRNGHVAPGIDESGPSLQHVTYIYEGNQLIRQSRYRLDPTPDTPVTERVLLSGVERLSIRYFNGRDWREDWEGFSATGAKLDQPYALAFELDTAAFGPVRMVFSTPEGY